MGDVIEDSRGQWLLLVAVGAALFMDGMDGSIVNVALPEITRDMGVSTGAASWVVTVYYLMMAGLILIFGKISDSGAIKKVFVGGFLIFAVSSLLCGISSGMMELLLFRAVQGVGAAMLAASAMMLCVKYYPARKMAFALSVTVLGASIGATVGPSVGGLITELASWHWIFLINVPIGLVAALFSARVIPPDRGMDRSVPFDYIGAILLFTMLASGLYTMEAMASAGLNAVTGTTLAVFVAALVLLFMAERRSVCPVVDLSLFRIPGFDAALLVYLLINALLIGILYLMPFYLSKAMGFDPMTSGLYLLVPAVMTLALCTWVSKLSDRTERRIFVVVACALMMVTALCMAVIVPGSGVAVLFVALICIGMSFGFAGGPASTRIVENTPVSKHGSASSMMSFIIYFASALGATLFAALFSVGSGMGTAEFATMPLENFMMGLHFSMCCAAVLSFVAILLSLYRDKKPAHE